MPDRDLTHKGAHLAIEAIAVHTEVGRGNPKAQKARRIRKDLMARRYGGHWPVFSTGVLKFLVSFASNRAVAICGREPCI